MDTMAHNTGYESIVFIGKITSGKGTQAQFVADRYGCDIFSTGNKVREATTHDSTFGAKVKETYEAGELMPEWIAEYWMMHALLNEYTDEKLVFEGVAKKPNEAELFHEIHQWLGRSYIVFNLDIPDAVVRERTSERKRDIVDAEDVMERRLREYNTHTARSLEVFANKGTLHTLDGTAAIETVRNQIFTILDS